MKNNFLLFSLLFFFIACNSGSDTSKMSAEIEAFEKEVEANANKDNSESLIAKYEAYINANPDDHDTNSRYLYRMAALQFRLNRFSAAIGSLQQALKNHYKGDNTENSALFLATIYKDKMRNEEAASAVYQCFIEAFPSHEKTAAIKKDYGNLPAFNERILDLGNRLMNDSTNRIDYRVANDFIGLCEIHALLLPEKDQSPDYLHKAGETARSIRLFPRALGLYDWIVTKYPNHTKAAQALFLKGFTYDNDMKKHKEARAIYEEFLAKYPNDDFADDTKFLLENLGKDDEEIIKQFGNEG